MHIGEGLLDLSILIPLWIIVFGYGIFSLLKMRGSVKPEQIPIISVITAMVFTLQMLNFPVLAGTSGHLLGFVLMAIFFSPSTAFIMISVILLIQSLMFGDGGLLALGANIFNMGIATMPGYFTYWIIRKKTVKTNSDNQSGEKSAETKWLLISAFVGAYISIIIASLCCGIEIGISEKFPYGIGLTIPAMLGYHALIGIGEGLITMVIVGFFAKYAPEYIPPIEKLPLWS
ncbi:energy-coupling factor ABC transporter permease [Promethearchaeum syntrophicum]|uniref:Energy-coupling factor ABC transporter permease n=1 Tax=Promethearchaeum syntrophicum TaxID=2594042 RepID=A0A5B9DA55_9ARCH|nr:energy-coupling factor ABC transporter permease [Candidatus Prometheoarchaeum syntrophicum]QEE15825.1 cobalt transport protein CbiM [Candidatus Prometheoarchaeum syntrophicum]